MATIEELSKAFNILVGAGLDYAPSVEEIPVRAESWKELLSDVPGDILITAAKDIALSGERFPSVSRVRKQATQVKIHNGTSSTHDPFEDNETRPLHSDETPGFYRWTKDGAVLHKAGELKDRVIFPPEIETKIQRIISKIGDGVMPDATLEYIDNLTAPYRG